MKIKEDIKELAYEVWKLNNTLNKSYALEILPEMPENDNEEVKDFAIKVKFNNKTINIIQTVNEEYFKFKDVNGFEPFNSPLTYQGDFELERKISLKDNKEEFKIVMISQLLNFVKNHEKEMVKEMVKEKKYNLFTEAFNGEISKEKTNKYKP